MSAPSPFDNLIGMTFGQYRCEEMVERSDLGPVYFARGAGSDVIYRVRVLPIRTDLPAQAWAAYLDRFLHQADHIATLKHPHILPLLDYGHENGLPYLIYPGVQLRPLTDQLIQNGPLDLIQAGRFLDQIAAALAYAHEHSTLHRHLTADTIHLQADGQIAVADFGVRRMIELNEADGEHNPLRFSIETAAPEQLTGRPVEHSADVYALGAVLYRMLTGSPVFTGRTREEIARQHVYAPVPSLSQWRADLPPELDDIIATAMAKHPEQRFPRPETMLNAYLQVVTPARSSRVFPPGASFAQPQVAMRRAINAISAGPRLSVSVPAHTSDSLISGPLRAQVAPIAPDDSLDAVKHAWESSFVTQPRPRRRRSWLLVVTAATLIAAILGTFFVLRGGTPAGSTASAQVQFADASSVNPGSSDELQIAATNLPSPPSGTHYAAWLINTQTEFVVSLGTLAPHGSSYTLTYFGRAGTTLSNANLLAVGDTFEVTAERTNTNVPVGSVVLRGHFPPISFVHIQHLLVSFPSTPGKIGLLVGVVTQTHLLVPHAQALVSAAQSHNTAQVQCEAQALLDILEGEQGPRYQPISSGCAAADTNSQGDGFGLLGSGASYGTATSGSSGDSTGYIAEATEHASLAVNQPDATPTMHSHVGFVIAALNNVRTWEAQIDAEATALLANPDDTSNAQNILTLAQHAYAGFDANHDGTIAAVAGEAGAITAYQQGQLMATLTITPAQS